MTDKLAKCEANFSLADMKTMAQDVVKCGLFPSLKTPEQVMTLMLICQSEGLHPIQALKRYNVIAGRAAINADAMLGSFQEHGGKVKWIENTATACEAEFFSPGMEGSVKVRWTMDDAKRAKLEKKDNWEHYPRAMLRARVISEGIRMAMPSIIVGIYTQDEIEDYPSKPQLSRDESVKASMDAIYQDAPAPDTTIDVPMPDPAYIPDAEYDENGEVRNEQPEPEPKPETPEERQAVITEVQRTIERIICSCHKWPDCEDGCKSRDITRLRVWTKAHGPSKKWESLSIDEIKLYQDQIKQKYLPKEKP